VRRPILVLAACVLPWSPLWAQQRAVTLAEALELAQRNAPAVVQAQGNARAAGAGVRSAWGEYLPRLTASSSYGSSFSEGPARIDPITQQVISGNTTNSSLGLGATASVELFTGFRRGADLASARATVTEADATVAYEQSQSALQTTNQFLAALQSADLVRVRQEAIRRAQEKVAIANAKLATRAATIADSLQAVVDLTNARLRLLSEERSLTEAEANLARFVGLDGRVAAQPDSSLFAVVTLPDTAALMTEATTRAPAVVRSEARVRSARTSLAMVRSTYLPNITLSGTTNFNGNGSSNYSLFNYRSINFGLNWTLFNGFARERDMAQRRATLDANAASAADARRQVSAALITWLEALRTAEQRVSLTAQSLEAARASARVQTERYRLGSISIEQLNQAQDALSSAETEAVNARYDYLRARAQIEAILGRKL
jgi:outer membrane protein